MRKSFVCRFILLHPIQPCHCLPCRGTLIDKGIIEPKEDPNGVVRTDAYSVSDFFGRVCAPRYVHSVHVWHG